LLGVHPWTSSRTVYRELLSVYLPIGVISQLPREFADYQAEAENSDTICGSPSPFQGDTALCRMPMCRLPEAAHRHSRTLLPGYLEKYALSPQYCIEQNVQRRMGFTLVVSRQSIHFSRRYPPKQFSYFCPQ